MIVSCVTIKKLVSGCFEPSQSHRVISGLRSLKNKKNKKSLLFKLVALEATIYLTKHTHTHTHPHTHTRIHTHTCMHARTHTHACMRSHTHTHTHTHTHDMVVYSHSHCFFLWWMHKKGATKRDSTKLLT